MSMLGLLTIAFKTELCISQMEGLTSPPPGIPGHLTPLSPLEVRNLIPSRHIWGEEFELSP